MLYYLSHRLDISPTKNPCFKANPTIYRLDFKNEESFMANFLRSFMSYSLIITLALPGVSFSVEGGVKGPITNNK
jgi:hypothetical protein